MLHSRQGVVCGAMLAGAVGMASAADLPPAPPAYPPPTAPVAYVPGPPPFSWTGFYFGGSVGYGWTNGSGTLTTTSPTGFPVSLSGNGVVVGPDIGFNWQFGPAVAGLEGDFQGTFETASVTATGVLAGGRETIPYFGTIRGRLGFAFERILLYATGGGVFAKDSLAAFSAAGPQFSSSATFGSWTAGAGIEAALWGPLSAKIEYLYINMPSSSLPAIPTVTAVSLTSHTNVIRAGFNYHF